MEAFNATDVTAAIGNLTPTESVYACQRCEDSGYIYDFDAHKVVGRCECAMEKRTARLNDWKASSLARLSQLIGERIQLTQTKPRDYMKTASESVWLHGIAGKGKTHAARKYFARMEVCGNPISYGLADTCTEDEIDEYLDQIAERVIVIEIVP